MKNKIKAWQGKARAGLAWQGGVWQGMAGFGKE